MTSTVFAPYVKNEDTGNEDQWHNKYRNWTTKMSKMKMYFKIV
jgi:hypothetical protein